MRSVSNCLSSALLLFALLAGSFTAPAYAESAARSLEVQSVVLYLIDEAEVPAQDAGLLVELNVREGDEVKQGQVLAQLDDRAARLDVQTAEVELQSAREAAKSDINLRSAIKSHEVAQAELKRSLESIERFAKSVSQSQLDVERLTVEKTRLEQEQAEHEATLAEFDAQVKQQALEAAQLALAQRIITAPFAGTVVETFIRSGEWIQLGQKALRIVSVDQLRAEGYLNASDITVPLKGAPVRLVADDLENAADSASSFRGSIVFVSPEMDPITGQVRVWAQIDNRERQLRPGQRVRMWVMPPQTTDDIAKEDGDS